MSTLSLTVNAIGIKLCYLWFRAMTITVPLVDDTANVQTLNKVMGDLFQFEKETDEGWR